MSSFCADSLKVGRLLYKAGTGDYGGGKDRGYGLRESPQMLRQPWALKGVTIASSL